jgi:hypothetical protein
MHMHIRRLRSGMGMVLALLVSAAALWLLTPEAIDSRIRPGMTRAEVEAILGRGDSEAGCERRYYSPDGGRDFYVVYTQPNEEREQGKQVVLTRYRVGQEFAKRSLWQRFRVWLRW